MLAAIAPFSSKTFVSIALASFFVLAGAHASFAVVAVDPASVASACDGARGQTITIPAVTVGAQADRILVVTAGGEDQSANCNLAAATATYGGTPMTFAVGGASNPTDFKACSGVFYLLNPPTGTAAVTVTFPTAAAAGGVDNRQAGAFVLTGAAQQAPEATNFVGANAKTNPVSSSITALSAGALVVDVISQGNPGSFAATAAGQTARWQQSCVSSSSASSTKPVAAPGATPMTWTHTLPKRYAHSLVSFAATGGGTTTTTSSTTTTTTTTTTSSTSSSTTSSSTTTTTMGGGGGQVLVDAASVKSACDGASGDTITIPSVTVGAQANRILVVSVGAEDNSNDCNLAAATVMYGAQALDLAAAAASSPTDFRACNGLFYLVNPPTGTANVSVTFPSGASGGVDNRQAGAYVLYDAAQQGPVATMVAGANASTNPIATMINVPTGGAVVAGVVTQGNTGSFATTQVGQVLRWQQSCVSSSSAGSTKGVAAAGSTSMGWSHSSPKRYAHALAAFAPAGGGGSTTSTTTTTTTTTTSSTSSTSSSTTSSTTTSSTTTTTSSTTTTMAPAGSVGVDSTSIESACSATAGDQIVIPNVTVGSQANRILVVTAGAEDNNNDCNLALGSASVFYGATKLTHVASSVSNPTDFRACNGMFILLNPPTGTQDVTVNFPNLVGSAIDNRQAGAFVIFNAAQVLPTVIATAGENASTDPVNTDISPVPAQSLVVDVFTQGNTGGFATTQSGQQERWEESCGSSSSASSTRLAAAPGTVTLGWDHSNPKRSAHTLAAFAPVNDSAGARVTIDGRCTILCATTFVTGSFEIQNVSGGSRKIDRISFDYSTGILPDMVFDPLGMAGDNGGKMFTPDSDTALVGLTGHMFSSPHDGGFDVLEVTFDDFGPGETFKFSVDTDPTSINGAISPGPNQTGDVGGLETMGTHLVVEFSDGTIIEADTFRKPGSASAGTNLVREGLPGGLSIEALGLTPPQVVSDASQTIRLTGPVGAMVSLVRIEGGLYLGELVGTDIDPFEANNAIAVQEYLDVIGGGGFVDIPVTLTKAEPEAGLNYMRAAIVAADGATGPNSDVVVLQYEPLP